MAEIERHAPYSSYRRACPDSGLDHSRHLRVLGDKRGRPLLFLRAEAAALRLFLGVAGGLVALWISRLSPGCQRRLKLAALGALAVFLTGELAFLGFVIATTAPMVREAGMFWWAIAGLFGMSVAAGLVWVEFRQEWKS